MYFTELYIWDILDKWISNMKIFNFSSEVPAMVFISDSRAAWLDSVEDDNYYYSASFMWNNKKYFFGGFQVTQWHKFGLPYSYNLSMLLHPLKGKYMTKSWNCQVYCSLTCSMLVYL
jgi:hypothetical protein